MYRNFKNYNQRKKQEMESSMYYLIAGFFRGRILSRISRFCGDSRKFSLRKSIFKLLDTALVGVVHWVTANSRKFSPPKMF